ncbi:MAG TPA: biotin--[acetyl-CoA-carboxylase] ligase [Elusimicrobia bacterium]|nr:biotin--[acetyl-CoA-carboxylase] ligase [Elusimicrobiota bacterium]HBT60460.1 biotin--[acetyl-CoA-carboxylase] ligase [Elusimicrobiota bacterium]
MNFPGVAQVLHLTVTDSTQNVARFLADQGAEDRTLVWADRQTAGRGRLRRRWASGPGGLYFSLILRPGFPPSRLADFNLAAARAAAEALGRTGIRARVKPPNDVIGSMGRLSGKICGILAEACGPSRRVDWLVLGVGINVNNAARTTPGAMSLKALTGRSWNPAGILRGFLEQFALAYSNFR